MKIESLGKIIIKRPIKIVFESAWRVSTLCERHNYSWGFYLFGLSYNREWAYHYIGIIIFNYTIGFKQSIAKEYDDVL